MIIIEILKRNLRHQFYWKVFIHPNLSHDSDVSQKQILRGLSGFKFKIFFLYISKNM